jgi:23S rRNA pseudoU1915 N3-methylase RlmH
MASIGALKILLSADAGNVNKTLSGLQNQISKVGSALAAGFAVDSFVDFGKKIIEVSGEFQKFNAVLTNTLRSASAAGAEMALLQDIASVTPFSVRELTDSFVKLVNGGFKPTRSEIIALGDLASSTGKSFDQLAEAVLDAQSGEFERLKEFGIKAKKSGDEVTFTFKGVSTTVKNTSTDIQNYLISLGKIEGVSGSMAAISETLQGKISNLGDTFDNLFRVIGERGDGILKRGINNLNKYITAITEFLKTDKQRQTDNQNKANSNASEFLKEEIKQLQKNIQEKEKLNAVDAEAKAIQQERVQLADRLLNAEQALADQRAKTANLSKLEGKRGRGFSIDGQIADSKKREQELINEINAQKNALSELDDIENKNIETKKKGNGLSAEQVKQQEKIQSTIKGIYQELANLDSEQNVLTDLGEGFNIIDKKQETVLAGIKKLIELGLKPESEAVKALVKEYEKLANIDTDKLELIDNKKRIDKQIPTLSVPTQNQTGNISLSDNQVQAIEGLKALGNTAEETQVKITDFDNALASAFSSGLQSAVANLVSGGDALKGALGAILSILGDFAIKYGERLIAIGIAENIALPGSGVPKIVGGGLLVVAGSLAKALSSSLGSDSKPKSSGGYKNGLTSVPGWANGHYFQLHSGESVLPAGTDMNKILSDRGFGGGSFEIGELVLRGDTAVALISRTTGRTNRVR